MFGARIGARNERKVLVLIGVQRERLASKVQPGEARFGPELNWEKPWRGQVFGAKMSETNGNKLDAREKWKKTVGAMCSGPRLAQEMREHVYFCRDSEGAFGTEGFRGSVWHRKCNRGGSFWIRIRLGKAVAGSGLVVVSSVVGFLVNPGGGPSHDLHDNDGASGVWPSRGCGLLQQRG